MIGKDRIISAESDPIDLGVFCVEPGVVGGMTDLACSTRGSVAAPMAAPNVRAKAMADKDQQQVWSEVGKTRDAMAETVTVRASAGHQHYELVLRRRVIEDAGAS